MTAGLGLLRSPVAWAMAAILAAFVYGHHVGNSRCEAALATAISEMQERHAVEIQRLLEETNQQLAAQRAEIDALETEVAAYEEEIAGRGDVCVLESTDAERLRNIR